MNEEQQAILRGAVLAAVAIEELKGATLGRCEGHDIIDGADARCPSTGVLIEEHLPGGRGQRHRIVCPRHGYERGYTPPVVYGARPRRR